MWLIGGSLLTGAGCVAARSVHPLSDPAKSKIDERLLGVWKRIEPNGDWTLLLIARGKLDGSTDPKWKDRYPTGAMQFQIVSWNADHTFSDGPIDHVLEFFPTQLGTKWYANLIEPSGYLGDQWDRLLGFQILSYEVRGDELRIYQCDEAALRKVVEAKELAGEVVKLKNRDARPKPGVKRSDEIQISITASTQNLQEFLKNGGDARLFPRDEKKTLVYHRMK